MGRPPLREAAWRDQRTGGDEAVDVWRALVERGELGDRSSVSGDEGTFASGSAPHRIGKARPEFSHANCVHLCTQSDLDDSRNCGQSLRMNFAFTEEQEELRSTIRAFLEAKSPETAVREQMETDDGVDAAVWKQMAEQMGLQGLHIPEEYGGSGFGYVELGIVLEEMGRSLLCAPFFSTVVLAANTLIHSGDEAAKAAYLPGIAGGETVATLAFTEPSGKWDEAGITTPATATGDGYTISGTKSFVLDGATANDD